MKMSESVNGEYENWDNYANTTVDEYMQKYWHPYFKVSTICTTSEICGYEKNNEQKLANGNSTGLFFTKANLRVPFLTDDGILYSISVATTAGNNELKQSPYIYIDINGPKKPNVYGKDIFVFTRVVGRGILPDCYNKTKEEVDNACSSNGSCCAAKIMIDGWQIKDSYPW